MDEARGKVTSMERWYRQIEMRQKLIRSLLEPVQRTAGKVPASTRSTYLKIFRFIFSFGVVALGAVIPVLLALLIPVFGGPAVLPGTNDAPIFPQGEAILGVIVIVALVLVCTLWISVLISVLRRMDSPMG